MRKRILGRTFIIAEAGVNHNGDMRLARKLIDAAKMAGADAVKFQTFKAERLVSIRASKVGYQKETTDPKESQFEMIKRLELDERAHSMLLNYCVRQNILFLSTPFDEQSADLLAKMNISYFKVPSGEVTNLPFLTHVARKGKPVILSTGMSTLDEVRTAVKAISLTGNKKLTLLHCVTEYPAPYDQLNLRAMVTMRNKLGFPVGFSDHSPGIDMAIAAVALGAEVIEKHLTLDRSLSGPDHKASLQPEEFARLVEGVRHVECALGDGIKKPALCEVPYISLVRKSVVSIGRMSKGHVICRQDLGLKRPGWGIQPKDLKKVVGRRVIKNIAPDETITWDRVK